MEANCPVCSDTGFEIRVRPDGRSSAVLCACSLRNRGDRLLRSAGIPRRYDHCTLDDFQCHDATTHTHAAAKQVALEWVEKWPLVHHGLLFLGKPGTGKTHLAVGIARELVRTKAARVFFCEQRQLVKEIQATFDAGAARNETDVLRPVLDCEVLILDDLGAGRITAWARDVIHDIIVQRYEDGDDRPMIVTSNYPTGDDEKVDDRPRETDGLSLKDRLGDALLSRLYEMCQIVKIEGRDFRREILQAKTQF